MLFLYFIGLNFSFESSFQPNSKKKKKRNKSIQACELYIKYLHFESQDYSRLFEL